MSGFAVASNVPFPQMHETEPGRDIDIEIIVSFSGISDWADPVPGMVRPYIRMCTKERVVLEHRIHGVLDITAQRINVDVCDERHWENARTYVLGTALAVSTFMRGATPYHMSSVRVGSTAIAFAGESNAGKSTWAALSILELDGVLLTDDVARVSIEPLQRKAIVWPSLRRLRFRDDLEPILGARGLKIKRDAQGRLECYDFPSTFQSCALSAIFLPMPWSEPSVKLNRVGPERRLAEILSNVFRVDYGFAILGSPLIMKAALEFASVVEVFELRYPPGMENAERNVSEFSRELAKLDCLATPSLNEISPRSGSMCCIIENPKLGNSCG